VTSRLSFTLPKSFDPMEFLPPRLMTHADYARYLVSLILSKLARGRVDERGYVRLHAKYLKAVMQGRYKPIVDALVNGDAVRRAPYVPGEKSYGYALGERYAADKHVLRPVTHPALAERLRQQRGMLEAEREARTKPIHRHLAKLQRRLRIDSKRAREVLRQFPPERNPYDTQGILAADIENRRYRLSVGKFGRVANNVTSLKRELRKTLHVQGERLTSVDLACCQPALIALLMTTAENYPNGLNKQESYNGSAHARRTREVCDCSKSRGFSHLSRVVAF